MNAQEISKLVNGELLAPTVGDFVALAPLEEAEADAVTFVISEKYLKKAESSRAGLFIVKKGLSVSARPVVAVEDPQWAMLLLLRAFENLLPKSEKLSGPIHPTAQIDPSAQIGPHVTIAANVKIGAQVQVDAGCFIGSGTVIGQQSHLYPNVTVRENTRIGQRCIIHSGAVLGADGYGFIFRDGVHHKIPQLGAVEIGDDVEVGANTTIDRATMGKTRIGSGTKIDNLVQIAHNVQVGKGCLLVAQVGVAGSTKIGNFVTLAGQVAINGHVEVGDRAIVAACSGVHADVAAGSILFGTPARPIQQERRIQAILSKLPELYSTIRDLKKKISKEASVE